MADHDTMEPEEAFKMKNAPGPGEAATTSPDDTEGHRFHGAAIPDDVGPDEGFKMHGAAVPDETGPDEAKRS